MTRSLLCCTILILLIFACAHAPRQPATTSSAGRHRLVTPLHKETPEEKVSAENYLQFLKSEDDALKGNFEKAREGLQTIIDANPDIGYLHYEMATNEADQKNFAEAISECEKALELSPNLIQARLLLARLYSQQEKHVEAANIL